MPAAAARAATERDLSLDYLRATLTLMVVAHHSALAYTTFAHADSRGYLAWAAPVVDDAHSLFFDYAENFNDVFFMSLMFFISGLFVRPSLAKSGAAGFLRHRALRLGLPFGLGVTLLMPLAYWAAWRAAGHDDGVFAYWRLNVGPHGWPAGPLWFVWVLLLFDAVAAGLFALRLRPAAAPLWLARPWAAFAVLFAVSALAYLPTLAEFGFGRWAPLLTKPFYFQICRILLYLAWFLAGVYIGAAPLESGLLARDGALARGWPRWVARAFLAYNLLVFLPRTPSLVGALSARGLGAMEAVLWVLSCVTSCFAFLALFRGLVRKRRPALDDLARSAFAIYLVHYVFVLWAQYALKGEPLGAGVKFALVFVAAVLLSWGSAKLLLRIPFAQRVL